MSMHDDWKTAKKESEKLFQQAYTAYFKEQEGLAAKKDPKAKQKILAENLKISGLDKGSKFTSYFKFADGFGNDLDKLEAFATGNEKAAKAVKTLTVDAVLKNSKLNATFKHYCMNSGRIPEVYEFVTVGHKKPPQQIYALYIDRNADLALNIDSGVKEIWTNGSNSGNWAQAKTTIPALLDVNREYLKDGLAKARDIPAYAKFLAADLGGATPDVFRKAADKCLDTAVKYAREVQAYGKRWSKMKPDFWTPLNVALNEIIKSVNDLKRTHA